MASEAPDAQLVYFTGDFAEAGASYVGDDLFKLRPIDFDPFNFYLKCHLPMYRGIRTTGTLCNITTQDMVLQAGLVWRQRVWFNNVVTSNYNRNVR